MDIAFLVLSGLILLQIGRMFAGLHRLQPRPWRLNLIVLFGMCGALVAIAFRLER